MGGNLYMMDATRSLTAAAIDLGEKPAVISGIAKLHLTERSRQVVNDAMDIVGGKGISMGPCELHRGRVHADSGRDHRRRGQHTDP